MTKKISISEGFKGEKAIALPLDIFQIQTLLSATKNLFITHIGYYPKIRYHLRSRDQVCNEHILIYCSDLLPYTCRRGT